MPMTEAGPAEPLGGGPPLPPPPRPELPATLDAAGLDHLEQSAGQWRDEFDEQLACVLDDSEDWEIRRMSSQDKEQLWRDAERAFADVTQQGACPTQRELSQWLRSALGLQEGSYDVDSEVVSDADSLPPSPGTRRSSRRTKGRCSAAFTATHGTCMGNDATPLRPGGARPQQQQPSQPQPATPSEPPLRPASRRKGRRR